MTGNIFEQAQKIIQAGVNSATNDMARAQLESIQLYDGYAEPGYDSENGCVATGNWNSVTRYNGDTNNFDTLDDSPERVAKLLEKIGVDLEWEDEWTQCDSCYKLFRTRADSYSWQMSGVITDSGCYCQDCLDPEDHLASLEGEDHKCNTLDNIDPAEHGYVLVKGEYENGFHQGQDADPKLIGKVLRQAGITRYLFQLTEASQFYITFVVYVHESEDVETAQRALAANNTDGPSNAENLRRSLQDAAAKMAKLPDGPGVKYAQCKDDGTADVRLVSPEEFGRGIGKPVPQDPEKESN